MKNQQIYLEDIQTRIAMIETFTDKGRAAFVSSLMIQESVIRCYEVIGEIVKRLDPSLLTLYPHIPWKQIAGFRDVLMHQVKVIWKAVEEDLPSLKQAIAALLAQTNAPPHSDGDA
ncbi:MAG: DUF86 domain-containing protein [Chloroflexi bacterium]|nr:DUF86 domain-containing protein [Chloroflexota bacterium]